MRVVVSLVLGLIAGVGMSSEWNQWILFTNGGDFGIKDQTFQTDIGFYVFKLPFYMTVVNWLFASGVIILLVTVVAHYLNGGIRLQSPVQRVTPQVKAHLSVILGLLALVKAADYWLQRYALTWSTRGTVDGATYTDVKAQLPAIYLLLFIALLSFGLFIYNIWRRGWVLPVVAVGLWALVSVVAGVAYPAFIQRFRVEPEESSKEAPYIQHNIEATRAALGLTNIETKAFDYSQDPADTTKAIDDNPGTIRNVRLLDPSIVTPTYQNQQSLYGFYRFNELDVDRYPVAATDPSDPTAVLPAETTQVVLGSRDLYTSGIPQQSWEGSHLAYTHGYGLALAPANTTNQAGQPSYVIRDIPIDVAEDQLSLKVDKPQLYYGENLPGYAITNTGRPEVDYTGSAEGEGQTIYEGTGGVNLDSFAAQGRLRPALRRLEPDRLELPHQRLAHRVRARHQGPHREGRPLPAVGRRPVPGGAGRADGLRLGRLHQHRQVPERPAGRHHRPHRRQWPRQQRAQLRAQLGEGGDRRLRRHREAVRRRPRRPDRGGLPEARSRPCSCRWTRCPRSCGSTGATRRTCSGSRPTCSAATTSPTRRPSTRRPRRGRWPTTPAAR